MRYQLQEISLSPPVTVDACALVIDQVIYMFGGSIAPHNTFTNA